MQIKFQHIEPHYLLKNYIEKMWLFTSSGKMLSDDLKLVVPNGNIKLTLSCQNGIVAEVNGKNFASKEYDITLTGVIDVPVILDVDKHSFSETIGIEFNPLNAYRFFHFPLNEIQNQIHSVTDLLGNFGKQIVEQTSNATTVQEKIMLLQKFLLKQLSLNSEDLIFDFCVEKITTSNGKVTINELEKKTGYSSRWLNMKFMNKLGISPKNLSSIVRFKHYYNGLITEERSPFLRNDFYEFYYDQSHFIKDFKRFTGLPPTKYLKQINEFGETYYKV